MPELYSISDVVVLPSHDEGFSLVTLEGMAMNKPVIVTPVGELPRLVTSGKEVLIVPKGDPQKLAASILSLYQNSSIRKQMGNAGRKKVEAEYDFGKVTKRVERVYESVISH
jgi:glycosyltransferase involved in cell wall biosynthesis